MEIISGNDTMLGIGIMLGRDTSDSRLPSETTEGSEEMESMLTSDSTLPSETTEGKLAMEVGSESRLSSEAMDTTSGSEAMDTTSGSDAKETSEGRLVTSGEAVGENGGRGTISGGAGGIVGDGEGRIGDGGSGGGGSGGGAQNVPSPLMHFSVSASCTHSAVYGVPSDSHVTYDAAHASGEPLRVPHHTGGLSSRRLVSEATEPHTSGEDCNARAAGVAAQDALDILMCAASSMGMRTLPSLPEL